MIELGRKILLVVGLILLVGCKGPKDALSAYLDASLKGDHITAYKYISSQDKQYKDIKSYLAESSAERNNLMRVLSKDVRYEIKQVEREGDQAVARVEITGPDYAQIIQELFQGDKSKASESSESLIKKLIDRTYPEHKIPLITTEWNYSLVKEKDGWKVFLGWELEAKNAELLKQAQELEKNKKFYEAKEKYQAMLEIDPENDEVKKRLEELEQKIVRYEQAQAYLGNILISEVKIKETIAGGLGVFLTLKNNGDQVLEMVETTIEFLDANGNIIAQKSFKPIESAKQTYDRSYAPLLPGQSRKFGITAQDIPKEWSGKVNVRISDLSLEE